MDPGFNFLCTWYTVWSLDIAAQNKMMKIMVVGSYKHRKPKLSISKTLELFSKTLIWSVYFYDTTNNEIFSTETNYTNKSVRQCINALFLIL